MVSCLFLYVISSPGNPINLLMYLMSRSQGKSKTKTSPLFGSLLVNIVFPVNGILILKANLLTNIKSPLSSVGIMEAEGILNGS